MIPESLISFAFRSGLETAIVRPPLIVKQFAEVYPLASTIMGL
jgi:hypothetical protein